MIKFNVKKDYQGTIADALGFTKDDFGKLGSAFWEFMDPRIQKDLMKQVDKAKHVEGGIVLEFFFNKIEYFVEFLKSKEFQKASKDMKLDSENGAFLLGLVFSSVIQRMEKKLHKYSEKQALKHVLGYLFD